MKRLLIAALSFAVIGCATTEPFQPLSGGTARQAWQQLVRNAGEDATLSSYSSLRIQTPEGRKSFRAAIDADGSGAVRVRAFTPVGTEVFAFEVRNGVMSFVDHGSGKAWRGPFSEVASQLGIPESLDAAHFARLAFGLPPGEGEADLARLGDGIVRQGGLEYQVSGVGLASVRQPESGWSVRYEPASFPPERVTFEDGSGRSIVVRHLDLSEARSRLEPMAVDPSYRCCYRPVITRD